MRPLTTTRGAEDLRGVPDDSASWSGRSLLVEVAVAGALCALDLASQWEPGDPHRLIGSGALPAGLVVGYAVLGYAVLPLRRSRPVTVFTVVWLHALAAHLLLPGYRPLLGLLLAAYTVAERTRASRSVLVVPATLLVFGLAMVDETRNDSGSERLAAWVAGTVLFGAAAVGTWTLGWWAGRNRRRVADLEVRRREDARAAVLLERSRIARELHDIVSHSVTVMVLQAAGAQRLLHSQTTMAEAALDNVQQVGTQAMSELRRMLGVLGTDADADAPDDLTPGPGLVALDDLVERVRSTGVEVDVESEGRPAPLDPSVDHTAYRVVQESLTNVIRHAGAGARASVTLTWTARTLRVAVHDDAAGVPLPAAQELSSGLGMAGLRERVGIVGGRLAYGPGDDDGFTVEAVLPVAGPGGSPAAVGTAHVGTALPG